ncbi:serine hydrolase [Rhabdothermincola salaria]|uniref:serine hydrolase n=1 Tax=Rhabdothermincola salaria TaxID=2903142 RepID=UPI001E4C1C70|nr:serine hydrolase [Rhabdothermincola salaria]MCD9625306.1 serine hydrolase [Rhabdothermincola salaria]
MGRRRVVRLRSLVAVVLAASLAMAGCTDDGEDDAGASAATSSTAAGSGGSGDASEAGALTRADVDRAVEQLPDIVEEAMAETGIPGVAVAIVHDDEVVAAEGFGVRDVDTDEPVGADTVFQIASLSKPVSSTIMAGLVGQGLFAWDDPIAEYDPDLQLSEPWVSEHVTFADTFSHRTGLPGAVAGNDLEGIGFDRDTILERLRYVPLESGFRENYSYSNFGMTMGGQAAAVAAGETWDDVADEVLFDPAGMTSTSMRRSDFEAEANRAEPHVFRDGSWEAGVQRYPDPQAPAGGVSSNVEDLAQWLRLQLAEGSLDGEQLIDADALLEAHTPFIRNRPVADPSAPASFYGLGWGVETEADGTVAWAHSGAFSTGAATVAKLLPGQDLGVVVLTNGEPKGIPEAIADAVLDAALTGEADTDEWLELWGQRFAGILGEPNEFPTPADPAPAAPDDAYVGTYANDYVGTAEVRVGADGGLEVLVGPEGVTVYPLEHFDGDEFTYQAFEELPDYLESATFDVADGRATSVTLSSLDGAGLGTLPRVG